MYLVAYPKKIWYSICIIHASKVGKALWLEGCFNCVHPSRYLLLNHSVEFNQSCYMTSPRGKGLREQRTLFFPSLRSSVCSSICLSRYLLLNHIITANTHMSLRIRPALSVEKKMLRNVRTVPTPHENREYTYQPAHPPTKPDLEFAVTKKICAETRELSLYHMRTANTHMSLRIHPAGSEIRYMCICWKKNAPKHKSCPYATTENSEYPYEPAYHSLNWNSLSVEKKSVPKHDSCTYATW